MKLPKLTVYVDLDGIETIIDEIKELQTYKLFETDDMVMVNRADVAEVFARHIKARAEQRGNGRQWRFLFKHENGENRYSCPVCNSLSDAPYRHCPFCGTPMEGVRA